MILESKEADARLSSEDNLVNRFKQFTRAPIVSIPSQSELEQNKEIPSVDDLVKDVDDKVNGAKGISNARAILASATQRLKERLIEVDKPSELARIASEMNKIVNGENESKKNTQNNVIIYRPVVTDINAYEIVQGLE